MDLYTEYAAKLFGKTPDKVTWQDRSNAKRLAYQDLYCGTPGPILLGLLEEQEIRSDTNG